MHKLELTKPDGRKMILFSRRPIAKTIQAPSPQKEAVHPNPHYRWHALRGEWVAYASHRQNRTFLPPKEYNPLAPMTNPDIPTEMPVGDYDIAVFDNLFPSLAMEAQNPPELSIPTMSGKGKCEVVVFTQESESKLSALSLDQIELLIDVWAERYQEIGAIPEIQYVLPFENRGIEVGVTLHHPHGQIYAYPFVPPIPARELEEQKKYFEKFGSGLLADMIQTELKEDLRVIAKEPTAVAFVPACARYTYEVWVAPIQARASLAEMTQAERKDFARVLKTVLLKYEGLWNQPFPYLMVFHQAPTDGKPHPEAHVHIQFYPPYRAPGKLKFLAGTELGAGMFANDSIPEEKAAELKKVEVKL